MLELPIFFVDAFTDTIFKGNQAAVCLLPAAITEESMQLLAGEFNLSETAFVQYLDYGKFSLRWFTPKREVTLCGHATLASAFIMYEEGLIEDHESIIFETLSGPLVVNKVESEFQMNFPLVKTQPEFHPYFGEHFFGHQIKGSASLKGNWIFELESPTDIVAVNPDFQIISENSEEGIILTAWSDKGEFDTYSRYFAPNLGIWEDAVTGFAHCALMDYFSSTRAVHTMKSWQVSQRGGKMRLEKQGDRVLIYGQAIKVYESFIEIPAAISGLE